MIETKPADGTALPKVATWSFDPVTDTIPSGNPVYATMATSSGASATSAFVAPGLTDPEAARQWHLGKLGDIATIWQDFTGKGVKVGVYDSGVQYDHPDLAPNYDASLEVVIDGKRFDGDYVPFSGPHGTSVAGLIAAARDGKGTVGVAYDAGITGVNIFDPYSGGKLDPGIFINASDQTKFLEAMRQTAKFDVVNHSWGSTASLYGSQFSRGVEGTDAARLVAAITFAADTGRGGLGTVQVNAAGNNSIDGQGDSSHTDRHWISVGAYREVDGLASNYSTRGASLLVSAPSNDLAIIGGTGIVATDLLGRDGYNLTDDPGGKIDYTDQFGGTSAASPIAAGVVTLMLDANDALGWRDVSNILAYSAKLPVAFDDATRTLEYTDQFGTGRARMNESSFVITGPGNNQSNGGGLHYSTDYGYGAVDAYAAVRMAEVWSLFGAAETSANEVHYASKVFDADITAVGDGTLDFTTSFNKFAGTPQAFEFTITDADIDLEHVDMTITYTALVDFSDFGIPGLTENDFSANRIKLTAPDGSSAFVDTLQSTGPRSADQQSYTFGFANFRGADATGTWKVELEANLSGVVTINDVKLDLYGSKPTNDDVYSYTNEFFTMAAVAGESGRTTLLDRDGGIDWINAAAVSSDVTLNLAGNGGGASFGNQKAFAIGRGTVIENAVTGDGDDMLTGNSIANKLYGMRGDDKLFGLAGNDTLDGGTGDDWLDGGKGNDLLTGGVGNDDFFFDNKATSGFDRITDFGKGDRLLVNRALRDGNGDGIITFGADSVLNLDGSSRGDRVQLDGVDPANGLKFAAMENGYYVYVLNDPIAALHG